MLVKTRDEFRTELDKLTPEQKSALRELRNMDAKHVDRKKLTQVFKKREALLGYLLSAENYHALRDEDRAIFFALLAKRITTSNN